MTNNYDQPSLTGFLFRRGTLPSLDLGVSEEEHMDVVARSKLFAVLALMVWVVVGVLGLDHCHAAGKTTRAGILMSRRPTIMVVTTQRGTSVPPTTILGPWMRPNWSSCLLWLSIFRFSFRIVVGQI